MTKTDHIEYWKISAEKSLAATRSLFETGNFVECLFWMHLTLEKLFKAHWVKDNPSDIPPKIHNLRKLAEQTSLSLTLGQIAFLDQMNAFQMEGRYPDFHFQIYQSFDEQSTKLVFDEAENLYLCLRNELP